MLISDADDQPFFARERLGHAAILSSCFAGHAVTLDIATSLNPRP